MLNCHALVRFFEAEVVRQVKEGGNSTDASTEEANATDVVLDYEDYELILQPTPLRTAPIYTAYFNW